MSLRGRMARTDWRRVLGISSATLVTLSIILLIVPGLPLGIDFQSGTAITYEWPTDSVPDVDAVREGLNNAGYSEAVIQDAGANQFFVRTSDLGESGKQAVDNALAASTGRAPTTISISSVSSVVASQTIVSSIIAVLVAAAIVMLYIMWAFRSVPKFHRYAVATLVALIHDVALTLGLFIIFGFALGATVNVPFVVAILTIIGYSVNDTIVVFDRIRENVRAVPGRRFRDNVRVAIRETVVRSLATSITTLIVSLSLLLFGGQTLRDFMLVLVVGIVVGTYSSIFVASAVLVAWEENKFANMIGRARGMLGRGDSEADAKA